MFNRYVLWSLNSIYIDESVISDYPCDLKLWRMYFPSLLSMYAKNRLKNNLKGQYDQYILLYSLFYIICEKSAFFVR